MSGKAKTDLLGLEGVRQAVASAEAEGWEPGSGDADAFFAADRGGFFRSSIDGRTIATISVVRGSKRIAFVGLYIVNPEFRGQGFGKELWDEVLDRFDGFTLGLDAVPEQVDTYASAGFTPAHGNSRFSIEAQLLPPPESSLTIEPAGAVAFDDLAAFDGARCFGPRPGFLAEWIAGPGREAVVTLDGADITGFAASRRTAAGHRIGPVFATGPEAARSMILTLARQIEGPVSIDVPEPNRTGTGMLRSLGMAKGFATMRMYRGPDPELPVGEIFGITTLELG